MINVIKANLSPIFYILLFVLVTVVALYFSFTFSYYLLLLSLPLLAFTIYALNGFIDTLKSDYKREVEKKEKDMFEKLSHDDAKEFTKNNPNSKIVLDEQRKREKDEEEEYISKKISSVYEPKLIKTINVKSIIQKNIFNVYAKTGLPVFFDTKDTKHEITQKIEEVRFTNQEISCFEWINSEGILLTLEEIKEQLRLRENRALNKASIKFNMSTESLKRRWFKIYNNFCFYERPSSKGMIRLSSVFTGALDNKIYEDGQLISHNKDKSKPSKEEVVEQYKIENDMPASMDTVVEGHKMLKRDMTGLLAYFKEMPNMERIYNEFTHSIRNGYTVEKYLNNTNFMDDNEIRDIVRKGFGVIAGFLEDMLKIKENTELRKDFNACKEVIKILQAKNDDKTESIKSQNISADDYFKQSLDYFNLGVANDPLTSEGASEMKKGIKLLDKAIKLDEKNPKYFYNRGTGKKMILDYKSAIPDFTKAIKLKFESPEMAYFNRAMSKLHIQDLEGSKKDNKKALELGYDEYQVEQLDDWIDSVTEMGYDEFMKQFD